jgi:hypothetical protein
MGLQNCTIFHKLDKLFERHVSYRGERERIRWSRRRASKASLRIYSSAGRQRRAYSLPTPPSDEGTAQRGGREGKEERGWGENIFSCHMV